MDFPRSAPISLPCVNAETFRSSRLAGADNKAMSFCKLCESEAKLIHAHVIPRSFWEIDFSQPAPRLVTNTLGIYPKKAPIGVYDQTILCEPCERTFGEYDSYAANLLLNRTNEFEPVRDETGKLTGYVITDYNYRLLKLFAIAVLWRAAASSHEFFRKVRIGPFEEKARRMLIGGDPGDAGTFSTLFSIWDDAEWPVIMDPFPERWSEVRAYRFYLGRFALYVKVDRRSLPDPLSQAALSLDGPLNLISRQLLQSNDFRVIQHILNARMPFTRRTTTRLG